MQKYGFVYFCSSDISRLWGVVHNAGGLPDVVAIVKGADGGTLKMFQCIEDFVCQESLDEMEIYKCINCDAQNALAVWNSCQKQKHNAGYQVELMNLNHVLWTHSVTEAHKGGHSSKTLNWDQLPLLWLLPQTRLCVSSTCCSCWLWA